MDDFHIVWSTWNRDGFKSSTSKRHTVDGPESSHTLCGTRIPQNIDGGVEYEDASYGDKPCKRCQKAEAKRDDEDKAENERLDRELFARWDEEKRAEGQWQEFGT